MIVDQVTILPAQLSRLAELFPHGGAVGISQYGNVISAKNSEQFVVIDAQGNISEYPNQETFKLC